MRERKSGSVFCFMLFLDIVRYSTLSMKQQVTAVTELSQILLTLSIFRQFREQALVLPTGDGFCVVFHSDDSLCRVPLQLAIDLQREVKKRLLNIPFRVGIHCGENSFVHDVNGNVNVVGSAINYAARIMALGDANHILISKEYHTSCVLGVPEFEALCHKSGEYTVKHGEKIVIYNVYLEGDFGNPKSPKVPTNENEKKENSRDMAKAVFTADELSRTPTAEFSENNIETIRVRIVSSLLELLNKEKFPEQRQRFWLGYFMVNLGDYEKAKRSLERFCQIDTRSGEAEYYLAACHAQTGNIEKALTHLEKAILLDDGNRGKAQVDLNFRTLWSDTRFNSMTA